MKRRWLIIIFTLCIGLAISACQSGSAIGSPTVTPISRTAANTPVVPQTGSTPVVTPGVGAQATKGPVAIDLVFGSGSFDFPDTKAGLANLTSYQATLILFFDGTRDGKAQKWSKTYVLSSAKNPAALQLTIEKKGDQTNLDPVFMAEANGAHYERRGANACNANLIEVGNSLRDRLEPAGFLTFVVGAEMTGSETVNNVSANHYVFDERAFGQPSSAKSKGEMWIAPVGGYIVRYLLTTKGNADYFGDGIQGTLTSNYNLTDVNQMATIKLPEDCPAGMIDAPLLPDATDVVNMPSLLTYTTITSLAVTVAFYQKQLAVLGWQKTTDPILDKTMALLEFTRSKQQLSLIITTADTGTNVHIVVEVKR